MPWEPSSSTPDGRIQHAGAVIGVGGLSPSVCTHYYQECPSDSPGYMGTLSMTTNYSAVTPACMLLRKAVYEEVGRLDEENLPVSLTTWICACRYASEAT